MEKMVFLPASQPPQPTDNGSAFLYKAPFSNIKKVGTEPRWFRTPKNPDVKTGPFVCSFTNLLVRSAACFCSLTRYLPSMNKSE